MSNAIEALDEVGGQAPWGKPNKSMQISAEKVVRALLPFEKGWPIPGTPDLDKLHTFLNALDMMYRRMLEYYPNLAANQHRTDYGKQESRLKHILDDRELDRKLSEVLIEDMRPSDVEVRSIVLCLKATTGLLKVCVQKRIYNSCDVSLK